MLFLKLKKENIMGNNILLSICIPTYKRANILDEALSSINKAMQLVDKEKIELVVSDNCSPDNTQQVIQKYISRGLPIKYIINTENIGADNNITQCFRLARGKYVWVLGDDDYLKEEALKTIIDLISNKDYGSIFIQLGSKKQMPYVEYDKVEEFFKDVSYGFTFISANIISTEFIPDFCFQEYQHTSIGQMPLYMKTAKNRDFNVIIHKPLLDASKDAKTSGGYNIFEVLINNYLVIKEKMLEGTVNAEKYYKIEKKKFFKSFVLVTLFRFYIIRNKVNFESKDAWRIVKKHYSKESYFYPMLIFYLPVVIFKQVLNKLKLLICQ
jgi:glycosyltransferase, family 2